MPSIGPGQGGRVNGPYGKLAGFSTATTYATQPYINPNAFTVATQAMAGSTSLPWTSGQVATNGQYTGVGPGAAFYVPGNATRVAALNLWGPSLFNLDLGLKRTFPIHEDVKLLFEVDALNALNHVVFATPGAVVDGGAKFGELTSVANTSRDFQLSARIAW
jgi:hypothetical protein